MRITSVLLFVFLALLGFSWNVIPAASGILTNVAFEHFSTAEYGLIFITLGLGGLLGGLYASFYGEKYGVARSLFFSLISYLFGYFFFGQIIISVYNPVLNFIFFLVGHLFLGLGIGFGIPSSYALILALHPKRQNVAVMAYSIPVTLGALLGSYFIGLKIRGFVILFVACAYLLLIFLFDFFVTFQKGTKSNEQTHLKGLWRARVGIFCIALLDALFIAWTLLYFEKIKHLPLSEATRLRNYGIISATLGRVVITLMLFKCSFRILSLVVPFLLCAISLSLFFFTSLNFFLMYNLYSFFYSILFPFIFVGVLERYVERPMRVSGELFAIFALTYSLGVLFLGYFSAFYLFFPVAALLYFVILLTYIRPSYKKEVS